MADSKTPLLIVSDAVSAGTGLGRITLDIARHAHEHLSDVYKVATFGWGGPGTSKVGFPQFVVEGMKSWILPTLPQVWEDFAGKEEGIILFIWDVNRTYWFSQPSQCAELIEFPGLRKWLLGKPKIKKWLYCPVDSTGPNDKLTFPMMKTLLGFDRILAYGKFGEDTIRNTIGDEAASERQLTSLPHGIDSNVFFPLQPRASKKVFLKKTGAEKLLGETPPLSGNELLIGCVATNQARKDWAIACETISILSKTKAVRFWIHTDQLEREHGWSIPALLIDFGILDQTVVSLGYLPDEDMAVAYSACDLTIGPGSEGWGFPLAESQFCGTPVVTGSYAGGADIVPRKWQVYPIAFRYEGLFSQKRPVYNPQDWAYKALEIIRDKSDHHERYDWTRIWPEWETWFRNGLNK